MALDTLDTTVTSIHPLTPRVKQFVLRVEDHVFDHAPGQHVSVVFRDEEEGLVVRPYSPVSRPGTDRIALAVKRYDDGTCSVWMHERDCGDIVSITTPSGNLHLRDPDRNAVFLSTGTGITPMIAMLKQLLATGSGQATFVFGERTQQDLMYRETLDHLEADHARLSVHYVLSHEDWDDDRDAASSEVPGRTGFVQDHLADLVDFDAAPDIYLCGVPQMVVDTEELLRTDFDVPDDRLFVEGWEEGAVG
jgi:ferredoxin-NADP reductase